MSYVILRKKKLEDLLNIIGDEVDGTIIYGLIGSKVKKVKKLYIIEDLAPLQLQGIVINGIDKITAGKIAQRFAKEQILLAYKNEGDIEWVKEKIIQLYSPEYKKYIKMMKYGLEYEP